MKTSTRRTLLALGIVAMLVSVAALRSIVGTNRGAVHRAGDSGGGGVAGLARALGPRPRAARQPAALSTAKDSAIRGLLDGGFGGYGPTGPCRGRTPCGRRSCAEYSHRRPRRRSGVASGGGHGIDGPGQGSSLGTLADARVVHDRDVAGVDGRHALPVGGCLGWIRTSTFAYHSDLPNKLTHAAPSTSLDTRPESRSRTRGNRREDCLRTAYEHPRALQRRLGVSA